MALGKSGTRNVVSRQDPALVLGSRARPHGTQRQAH